MAGVCACVHHKTKPLGQPDRLHHTAGGRERAFLSLLHSKMDVAIICGATRAASGCKSIVAPNTEMGTGSTGRTRAVVSVHVHSVCGTAASLCTHRRCTGPLTSSSYVLKLEVADCSKTLKVSLTMWVRYFKVGSLSGTSLREAITNNSLVRRC